MSLKGRGSLFGGLERKGEERMKRMQGRRKRKQAGRQDQDNPARPRLE